MLRAGSASLQAKGRQIGREHQTPAEPSSMFTAAVRKEGLEGRKSSCWPVLLGIALKGGLNPLLKCF